MKKSILLWMCLVLCLLAAGCSTSTDTSGGEAAAATADATAEAGTADDGTDMAQEPAWSGGRYDTASHG